MAEAILEPSPHQRQVVKALLSAHFVIYSKTPLHYSSAREPFSLLYNENFDEVTEHLAAAEGEIQGRSKRRIDLIDALRGAGEKLTAEMTVADFHDEVLEHQFYYKNALTFREAQRFLICVGIVVDGCHDLQGWDQAWKLCSEYSVELQRLRTQRFIDCEWNSLHAAYLAWLSRHATDTLHFHDDDGLYAQRIFDTYFGLNQHPFAWDPQASRLAELVRSYRDLTNLVPDSPVPDDIGTRVRNVVCSLIENFGPNDEYVKRFESLDFSDEYFAGTNSLPLYRARAILGSAIRARGVELIKGPVHHAINHAESVEVIVGNQIKGDQYNAVQAGSMGPGAHAHDINFIQVWNESKGSIALDELAKELVSLREAVRKRPPTPEYDSVIGKLADAEKAARNGDGPGALRHLAKAGKWAVDVATGIGAQVAASAISAAMGLS